MISDAIIVQVISTIGTIATVLISNSRVKRRVDTRHNETQDKLDNISQSLNVVRNPAPFADLPKSGFPKRRNEDRD